MHFSKELEEKLSSLYPVGSKVRCISMIDPQAVPSGTVGTIKRVDGFGHIGVNWETGSSLSLIYGEDEFELV